MNCIICNNQNAIIVDQHFPGYLNGSFFEIISCAKCNTNFSYPRVIGDQLYDWIYTDQSIPGYDRYYQYAKKIIKFREPLDFLAKENDIYYPIYNYLQDKSNLKILDIGCSYGYLVYALNVAGHKTLGVDVSKKAIDFAIKNFGDSFQNIDAKLFLQTTSEKFDVIHASELIEHLLQPQEFINDCLKILNKDGVIIITTPNKDFMPTGSVWLTDRPPVHTVWLSEQSFYYISQIDNLEIKFTDYSLYYPRKRNYLAETVFNNFNVKRNPGTPSLLKNRTTANSQHPTLIRVIFRWIFIDFSPIRYISNILYNKFINKYPALGVILSKK